MGLDIEQNNTVQYSTSLRGMLPRFCLETYLRNCFSVFTMERGCEFENYDLSDVKNIPSHTMCADQCKKNKRCTHATYYFNNQVCFLQHASSKALIQETRSRAINSWCIMYNDEDRYEPAVGLAINESRSLKK
uniref:Apple domain-containing protein n=1 Tax=Romanomermis culicivorax TaxID=13658 RepID=A0A915J3Q3_ROMCU